MHQVLLLLVFQLTIADLAWGPCQSSSETENPKIANMQLREAYKSFNSFHQNLKVPKEEDGTLQCATLFVAFNGSLPFSPTNNTLQVEVTRYALNKVPGYMVWHFAGGPGDSAIDAWKGSLATMAQNYNADVYIMDIRGVGRNKNTISPTTMLFDASTAAQLEAEWNALRPGEKNFLPFITTDQNCHDIHAVIQSEARTAKQKIMFVGHSYGSFLVHRFTQIYPGVVDHALLDSNMAGPGNKLVDISFNTEKWLAALVKNCLEDSVCVSKFGDQPGKYIKDFFQTPNICPEVMSRLGGLDRFKFAMSVLFVQPHTFAIGWLYMYRMKRCDSYDQAFLNRIDSVFQVDAFVDQFKNEALATLTTYHMRSSELARFKIPTLDEIHDEMQAGLITDYIPLPSRILYKTKNETMKFWPWAQSPYDDKWVQPNKTTFTLIHGQIDWNTPLFEAQNFIANVKGSKLNVVPAAGHCAGLTDPCGQSLVLAWVVGRGNIPADAKACLQGISGPTWKIDPMMIQTLGYLFFEDLYDTILGPRVLLYILVGVVCFGVLLIAVIASLIARRCGRPREDAEVRFPLLINEGDQDFSTPV